MYVHSISKEAHRGCSAVGALMEVIANVAPLRSAVSEDTTLRPLLEALDAVEVACGDTEAAAAARQEVDEAYAQLLQAMGGAAVAETSVDELLNTMAERHPALRGAIECTVNRVVRLRDDTSQCRVRDEQACMFTVHVRGDVHSLARAVKATLEEELLSGDNSYNFEGRMVPAYLYHSIGAVSSIFVVHTNRVQFDYIYMSSVKNNQLMTIPDSLDLSTLCAPMEHQCTSELPLAGTAELVAVVSHRGTATSGVFTTRVRDSSGTWHCIGQGGAVEEVDGLAEVYGEGTTRRAGYRAPDTAVLLFFDTSLSCEHSK
eukprot:TRINITY_DN12116_c0_g1_i1.p1 TRINITY_DN12116_c0_g1~~TRINITY_DN12116_c0_g1_i1.p1  ORF type:complete len:353 (-),score=102.87 TRINITY_DN12116_c0_g1_i1:350-1297(-)